MTLHTLIQWGAACTCNVGSWSAIKTREEEVPRQTPGSLCSSNPVPSYSGDIGNGGGVTTKHGGRILKKLDNWISNPAETTVTRFSRFITGKFAVICDPIVTFNVSSSR